VIHEFVERLFLLALGCHVELGNNFNGRVRTGEFASGTSRSGVFIVLIVQEDHFALESFRQVQCFPVIGVLLRDDLFVMRKVISCTAHTDKERLNATENLFYVFKYEHLNSLEGL